MKRKMIITLMLAIVSSVWVKGETFCFNSYVSAGGLPPCCETGTLKEVDFLCRGFDDRCPCKTIALVTDDNRIFYLSGADTQTLLQLENLASHINERATISGVSGFINDISVEKISLDNSPAQCFFPRPIQLKGTPFEGAGELRRVPFPWLTGDCLTCMTVAVMQDDQLYYLIPLNDEIENAIQATTAKLQTQSDPIYVTASGNLWDSRNYGYHTIYQYIYVNKFCENYTETPSDTIPLYVKDGPGTSTVDPIDPNLIVALLQTDLLVIKEFTGMEIGLILSNGSPNQAPARGRTPQQQQSFRNKVSIPLTEPGVYTIELTSPEWDYSVTGTFSYMPQGIETVSGQETVAPVKTLQNGQLFIIRSGKTFTLTGQEMK